MTDQTQSARKISLPDYCCPQDVSFTGGDDSCDHDYPPESKDEHATYVQWTCGRCAMRTRVGVYE